MNRSFLDTILEEKRREVGQLKLKGLPRMPGGAAPIRDFDGALKRKTGIALIGEIKFGSPSSGFIRAPGDPVPIASGYARAGAAALSVLTDRRFFQGDIAFLRKVKAAVPLPVLRKDFIIDPLQVEESARYGADAFLLIARALSRERLTDLIAEADRFHLSALVEVHSREDAEKAVQCGAKVIGINNRDLQTFLVDLDRTLEIRPLLPPECTVVSASGITGPDDVRRLAAAGVDAVLVGTALMAEGDPAGKARSLVEAGRARGQVKCVSG